MSLLTVIQKMVKNQLEMCNIKLTVGVVTSVQPFTVKINERLVLSKELIVFPAHLQKQILQYKDWKTSASSGGDVCSGSALEEVIREIIIQPKLQVGDKLIMTVVGEEYVIIDKVGDPDDTITYTTE